MEYVLYDKLNDKFFVLYLDNDSWSASLYYFSTKLNLTKVGYINIIASNKNIEVICEL